MQRFLLNFPPLAQDKEALQNFELVLVLVLIVVPDFLHFPQRSGQ
jgi:hypothetical protein